MSPSPSASAAATALPPESSAAGLTPERSPLSEAEALAQLVDMLGRRGVDDEATRLALGGDPLWLNVRYASQHVAESQYFGLQIVLVAMDAAHVAVRLRPPVDGGIKVAALPAGESEVGLKVILVYGHDLQRWADGELSEQEFVYEWEVGTVPKE